MNIDSLTETTQEAQAALDEARHAEAAERERLEEKRNVARRAAEQKLMDTYDPRALAADVRDSFEAMVDAAATGEGDLLELTVRHIAAIRRPLVEAQAASALQANGATPPDSATNASGRLRLPQNMHSHRGGEVGDIDKYAPKVLAQAIELGARRRLDAEQGEREQRVRAAVEAVE